MIIEVSFRVLGDQIPFDHSYALYSTLSRQLPELHEAEWLGIHRITGVHLGLNRLRLRSNSELRLRLPSDRLPSILGLAGARLRIFDGTCNFHIRLGVPQVFPLRPVPDLFASCVVVKLSDAEQSQTALNREMYLSAVRKKLQQHEITGDVWIDDKLDKTGRELSRRVLRIKNQTVIGYAVHVKNLNDFDSIRLQAFPIFGRRRFGAGLFMPAHSNSGVSTVNDSSTSKNLKPNFKFLLAKSYPGYAAASNPPSYALLLPHLRAVERAGESIVQSAGDLILEQLALPNNPWHSRLERAVRVASLCHDLGKANDGFQKMIRRQLEPIRQPARHELLSALLLADKNNPVREWAIAMLEQEDAQSTELLISCVIGAVGGHHVKLDEEWRKAALALRGGCGRTLDVLLDHSDLKPLLGEVACDRMSLSLIDGEQTFLGHQHLPFNLASNRWRHELMSNPEWWRFAAAVKALVAAADVAGSAMLPERGRVVIRDWVRQTLSNRVTSPLMQGVVNERLNGAKPRPFQEVIGASTSRVTLVEAGCGSGKTAAAYMWAARHADGKKLFFCYPTTGTATEGFLGYVHEAEVEARLIHSRSIVDLEGIAQVIDDDKNDHLLRIESLNAWSPQTVICTADTVLALVRNNRRG
ncbi:MAG TPA: type I-MYXAN CRISPR-associated protein Cas6/Cmx6, partial [Pyrinomonadaceae bacterium]|nr:type I-MYXAN CRISPR-associated protein Cas6/Cmx6 [Pyrinomonadaceae bacterium]